MDFQVSYHHLNKISLFLIGTLCMMNFPPKISKLLMDFMRLMAILIRITFFLDTLYIEYISCQIYDENSKCPFFRGVQDVPITLLLCLIFYVSLLPTIFRLSELTDYSIKLSGTCLHGGCMSEGSHSGKKNITNHLINLMWIHRKENIIWPQKNGECFCGNDKVLFRYK